MEAPVPARVTSMRAATQNEWMIYTCVMREGKDFQPVHFLMTLNTSIWKQDALRTPIGTKGNRLG
jgi:hypothetical protein